MSEQLEVMVIPFQQETAAVIPRTLVEYVLPYAAPLPSSYAHYALVGAILYQNEKVPVLDICSLYSQEDSHSESDAGHRRLVVVSCLNQYVEFSSYAIIADDAPRLFKASEENTQTTDKPAESPFHSHIVLDKLTPYDLAIVDLEALESMVFAEYLAAAEEA